MIFSLLRLQHNSVLANQAARLYHVSIVALSMHLLFDVLQLKIDRDHITGCRSTGMDIYRPVGSRTLHVFRTLRQFTSCVSR